LPRAGETPEHQARLRNATKALRTKAMLMSRHFVEPAIKDVIKVMRWLGEEESAQRHTPHRKCPAEQH
jgi:cytochrome c1